MEALINLLAGAYLGALETGAKALAIYAIPILGVAAFIEFHRQWWPVVLHGGSQMGEMLGHFLFLLLSVGFYMWLLVNLWDIANAALDSFVAWGTLGGGNGLTPLTARNPGFIMTMGMQLAFPFLEQATWWQKAWGLINQAVDPVEWIVVGSILIAFAAITVHHLFMLIEFYLALMCGQVLIGWGLWRQTAHFGEFALGWITGSLIRALVSCTMIGISIPLFAQIRATPGSNPGFLGGTFPEVTSYAQNMLPLVASVIFAVLAWVLPARAARMASGATLGLTGSTISAAAMTVARFGMMATGMAGGAVRGASSMIAHMHK